MSPKYIKPVRFSKKICFTTCTLSVDPDRRGLEHGDVRWH